MSSADSPFPSSGQTLGASFPRQQPPSLPKRAGQKPTFRNRTSARGSSSPGKGLGLLTRGHRRPTARRLSSGTMLCRRENWPALLGRCPGGPSEMWAPSAWTVTVSSSQQLCLRCSLHRRWITPRADGGASPTAPGVPHPGRDTPSSWKDTPQPEEPPGVSWL